MAFVIADRVRETTTTIGTGSVTLGGAYTSFQTFSAAIGNGNNTYYTIASASSGEWEVGIGTYASGGNLLSRDTVLASSNAGNLVNFSVGSKDVFVTQPSERSLLINSGSTGLFAGNAAFTANGIPYANSTTTLTTGSALTFDGTNLNFSSGYFGIAAQKVIGSGNGYAGNSSSASSGTLELWDSSGSINLSNNWGLGSIKFGIGGSEQMRLTSTGLGIGTSSPTAAKLHVAGYNGGAVYPIRMTSTNAGVEWAFETGGSNAAGSFLAFRDIGNSATRMLLDASGNLGLGVTPSAWATVTAMQVKNAAFIGFGETAYVSGNAYFNGGWKYIASSGAGRYDVDGGSGGIHRWYTAASGNAGDPITFTQAMTLDASGRLLIGTTSATASGGSLQIGQVPNGTSSSIGFNNNDNAVISARYSMVFQNDSDNNIGGRSFEWKKGGKGYSDGTSLMTLDASGNLGIGTSSPASGYLLTVGSGTASTNGTVALNGGSDSNYGSGIAFRRAGVSKGFIGTQSWVTSGTSDDITLYASASGALRFYSNGAQNAILDSSGNLGLGVTPSAWASNWKAFQIGSRSLAQTGSGAGDWTMAFNAVFDSTDSRWEYQYTGDSAVRYSQTGAGIHAWYTAPSGTAGNAITFTQAMTLDASGNLGIGTSSPASKLHVVGSSGGGDVQIGTSAGANQYQYITFGGTNGGTDYGWQVGRSSNTSGLGGNGAFYFYDIKANATRMSIDSSGNLGLGVTPSAWGSGYKAIQVGPTSALWNPTAGYAQLSDNSYVDSAGTSRYIVSKNATTFSVNRDSGAFAWFTAPSGNAGDPITFTQAMTLDASGNLLVGQTSARDPSGTRSVAITGTGVAASLDLTCTSSGGRSYAIYTSGTPNNGIQFYDLTANTERARIDSSGNLLVGTTSSSGKTTVVQSANSPVIHLSNTNSSFTDGALIIYNTRATTNSTYNHFACYNGDFTGQFIVRDSGNAVNSNNSYGAVSDVKLKENIVDASPKLADLMQVKVRNYNLIGDTAKQLGVVAQELETVFPAMVEESPDRDREGNDLGTTTKSVKYSVFVPMLIKALQELKAEFDAYKATHP